MAEKAENTSNAEDRKKSITYDANGEIAPPLMSSEKGEVITAAACEDLLSRCYMTSCGNTIILPASFMNSLQRNRASLSLLYRKYL